MRIQSLRTPLAGMIGLMVCAPWVAAAESSDQAFQPAPQPAICVQLSISVQVFDPTKPMGAIRCVVTNRTDRAVEIADRYDGKQIALIDPSRRWPLRLWDRSRDRPEPKTFVLEPGQQRVLFEFSLAEILRIQDPNTVRRDFETGRRVLVWDWPAMPAPPPSPVYVGRDGGLVDKVVFRAELTVEGAVITSNEVVLKLER